jgi:hypothetical protein
MLGERGLKKRGDSWFGRHAGWIATAALFGFVGAKVLMVARMDTTTAVGMLSAAGVANVALAVVVEAARCWIFAGAMLPLLSAMRPEIRPLTRQASWIMYLLLLVGGFLIVPLLFFVVMFAVGIAFANLLYLTCDWLGSSRKRLWWVFTALPYGAWAQRAESALEAAESFQRLWQKLEEECGEENTEEILKKLKEAGLDEQERDRLLKTLEVIKDPEGAYDALKGYMGARNARSSRVAQGFLTPVVIGSIPWLMVMLMVALSSAPWLPAEVIDIGDEEPLVGYVLGADSEWTSVLVDQDRSIRRVETGAIQERHLCQTGDPSVLSWSFAELITGWRRDSRYPSCYDVSLPDDAARQPDGGLPSMAFTGGRGSGQGQAGLRVVVPVSEVSGQH